MAKDPDDQFDDDIYNTGMFLFYVFCAGAAFVAGYAIYNLFT